MWVGRPLGLYTWRAGWSKQSDVLAPLDVLLARTDCTPRGEEKKCGPNFCCHLPLARLSSSPNPIFLSRPALPCAGGGYRGSCGEQAAGGALVNYDLPHAPGRATSATPILPRCTRPPVTTSSPLLRFLEAAVGRLREEGCLASTSGQTGGKRPPWAENADRWGGNLEPWMTAVLSMLKHREVGYRT